LEEHRSVGPIRPSGDDFCQFFNIGLIQSGENGNPGSRAEFPQQVDPLRAGRIENEVGPASGAELDAIVKFQLVALDLFAVDESARTAAHVHKHEAGAFGLDFGVITRDSGGRDHEISTWPAPNSEGEVIQRNSALPRAMREDYFRELTSGRTDCRSSGWNRHGGLLES